jgi:hypothetical protein
MEMRLLEEIEQQKEKTVSDKSKSGRFGGVTK